MCDLDTSCDKIMDNNLELKDDKNDLLADKNETIADKLLDSIKFYTLFKNTKKIQALKHYLIAKNKYEEYLRLQPHINLNNIRNKLIHVIDKLIELKSFIGIKNSDGNIVYNFTVTDLYFQLVDLHMENGNIDGIVSCYNKIINIFIKEYTTINYTFNSIQIVDIIHKLFNGSYHYYALLYSLKIKNVIDIMGDFNLISRLNNIIAVCYLNLDDFRNSARVFEDEYVRSLKHYEGILASKKQTGILMTIVYSLYDCTIARNKFKKYFDSESEHNKILMEFIDFISGGDFSGAKELLEKKLLCDNNIKNNLYEILDKQNTLGLLKSSLNKSKNININFI